jgi:hypothetical protein
LGLKTQFLGWAYRTLFGAPAVNVLMPPVPRIYLRLRFRDPEGIVRDFPPNYPIRVQFGDGVGSQFVTPSPPLQPGGLVTFNGRITPPWREFTLQFQPGNINYFICEAPGSPPASPPTFQLAPNLAGATANRQRYFNLPPQWQLGQADWSPPPAFAGNGRFSPPRGLIQHTVSPPADIGSVANPIVLVLDPHWKYLQFQYFDRFYGHGLMDSPPGSGHQRRISIPAIALEGLRNDPAVAASPPDTHSNWTIGADPRDLIQCLPWVLRRDLNGAAISPPMRGSKVGMRFRTNPALVSTVYSKDENTREIRHVSPPGGSAGPLEPGPERLRYYDLPRIWKSANYFARGVPDSPPGQSPPAGQFFDELNVADLARSDARATPLIFSLDDIVLTDPALTPLPAAAGDRIAVIHHRFADRQVSPPAAAPQIANVSTEGVYKAGADASPPGYPFSNIGLRRRHYLTDYPDWTRLVIAQGNLYDVFGNRTPDSAAAGRVVGARAAVRWVDATVAPNGVATANALEPRPGATVQTYFSIQPFYRQQYLSRWHNPQAAAIDHDEWNAPYTPTVASYYGGPAIVIAGRHDWRIGRLDLANIRCCDRSSGDEVAVLLRYQRFSFDFTAIPANPLAALAGPAQRAWAKQFIDLATARWNGPDAAPIPPAGSRTVNEARAWILTSPPQASPPLRTQIVTFMQYVDKTRAHFDVQSDVPAATSAMDSVSGTGNLRSNALPHDSTSGFFGPTPPGRGLAASHEAGHCGSMPDEYRSNTADSPDWRSLHLLGNPYVMDLWGLMNRNWDLRARYFWHAAEWLRTQPVMNGVNLRIHHGANESNFVLPHYPHAPANPGRTFVNWPVRFNLRQRTAPDNSCFDSYLYMLGADGYSTTFLPAQGVLGGGARIDAILVVMVRVNYDLRNVALAAAPELQLRDRVMTHIKQRFDADLNFRFTADFQVHAGVRRQPNFTRCLLQFIPCFTSQTVNNGSSTANYSVASPHHLRLTLSPPPSSPPSFINTAPPGSKTLTLELPAGFAAMALAAQNAVIQRLGNLVFDYCCATMGLTSQIPPVAGHYQSPPSHVRIVRTVMDAAAPNPVIS